VRIRTASWCHFIRNPSTLRNPHLRAGPVADTKWWASLLETWTNAEDYQTWAYPILSASELLDDPKAIYVVQSAFAGSEGKHPGGDTSTDI
jgi:hypothetical protein